MKQSLLVGVCLAASIVAGTVAFAASPAGRWDLDVTGREIRFPAWLEIAEGGGGREIRYVGRVGNARDIRGYKLGETFLQFSRNEWFGAYEMLDHTFRFAGDRVTGTLRRANGDTLEVTGKRAPTLRRQAPAQWSPARSLFDGTSFADWRGVTGADLSRNWRIRGGELVTFGGGGDVRTADVFDDFQLHLEFNYPMNSNSGVYLRGRYELQIEDDSPKAPLSQQTGGLYGWFGPATPVPRQPDRWHTLDVTLVGRRITVLVDGVTLYADREIPGLTGGALDSDEAAPGPIVLQASHSKTRGEVRFRNLTIATPAVPAPAN